MNRQKERIQIMLRHVEDLIDFYESEYNVSALEKVVELKDRLLELDRQLPIKEEGAPVNQDALLADSLMVSATFQNVYKIIHEVFVWNETEIYE